MRGTVERAKGRWQEILPEVGIERKFLVNRHGPCPLCGGKDRFRFDDRDGSGSYFCNQCGAGPGLLLARKRNGWSHAQACAAVDRIIGIDEAPAKATPPVVSSDARRTAAIRRTLAEATCPDIIAAYHRRRGLSATSSVLRGHPACPYFNNDHTLIGRIPAVIVPITAPDGRIITVQRVYDTEAIPRDQRKKTMPTVESIVGTAVRLHDAAEEMGVGEGYETCLAALELFGVPVWAGLTEAGLQSIVLPPIVRRLHVFADNDVNFVGQAAAYMLAKRVSRDSKGDIAITVHLPREPGTDWLDVLNERQG